jgi:thymidylate synthase (FAD)
MARINSPEADALIEKQIDVLDKGFVRLIDYMGGDDRIVQSARVSYGTGTKTVNEDKGLINYLLKNAHTSPFEQVELVFHLKLPLFVFAQLVRHRMASLNSLSARYSLMEEEFYLPKGYDLRAQSNVNKQVGDGEVEPETAHLVSQMISQLAQEDYHAYTLMIEKGVSREQARMVLPQNLYTQIYWKIDLHNLFHFLRLRLDWHAQQEIRVYAEAIARCAKAVAPLSYDAFEEHIQYGERFSRTELELIRALIKGEGGPAMSDRHQDEFYKKLGIERQTTGQTLNLKIGL